MTQTKTGYSTTSIIVHWLTAIFVVVLFVTGEGSRSIQNFHIASGTIVGVFLVWRVIRRIIKGMTSKPDQAAILNNLSTLIIWGMMIAIIVATLTGYLLPWTRGFAITVFDLVSIPSPINANNTLHELTEELHELSSHALIPLVIVHTLGALKHHFIDKDDIAKRMVSPVKSGK